MTTSGCENSDAGLGQSLPMNGTASSLRVRGMPPALTSMNSSSNASSAAVSLAARAAAITLARWSAFSDASMRAFASRPYVTRSIFESTCGSSECSQSRARLSSFTCTSSKVKRLRLRLEHLLRLAGAEHEELHHVALVQPAEALVGEKHERPSAPAAAAGA
jgi:hypothetical protein